MSILLSFLLTAKALCAKLLAKAAVHKLYYLAVIPPSAPANSFFLEGISTIYWGTDGFLQDAGLTTALVKSVKDVEKNEIIYITNNAGFEAVIILLKQGRDIEITVVDDSTKNWPGSGGKAMWKSPDDVAAVAIFITNKDISAAQKSAGERSFKARIFTAFNVV